MKGGGGYFYRPKKSSARGRYFFMSHRCTHHGYQLNWGCQCSHIPFLDNCNFRIREGKGGREFEVPASLLRLFSYVYKGKGEKKTFSKFHLGRGRGITIPSLFHSFFDRVSILPTIESYLLSPFPLFSSPLCCVGNRDSNFRIPPVGLSPGMRQRNS